MSGVFAQNTLKMAERVLSGCRARGIRLATAESCTGGLIAACLTDIPGSSDVFDRGFVTYSNEAKQDMLGVPVNLFATDGAVSKPVACAMAEGALKHSRAALSVAVTGVAGPGGGTAEKPVGLVHLAVAGDFAPLFHKACHFAGDRHDIRAQTLIEALVQLNTMLDHGV